MSTAKLKQEAAAIAEKLMGIPMFEEWFKRAIEPIVPPEELEGIKMVAAASWEASRSTALGLSLDVILEEAEARKNVH